MLPYDRQREIDLLSITEKCLGRKLSSAEQAVVANSTSSQDFVGPVNHARSATIGAGFIRWLVSNVNAAPYLDVKGVRLRSTVVQGDLDLDNCRLSTSLVFKACSFDGEIRLDSTIARNIEFQGCTFAQPIKGGNATVEGSLYIKDSQVLEGIELVGINVAGDLSMAGLIVKLPSVAICLNGAPSIVICLDGARVNGSVLFTDGFRTAGSVQMNGAVMGNFNCCGAVFSDEKAVFSLDGIVVRGDLSFSEGFSCVGEIRLPGARISGNMECIRAEFGTLICHNMVVEADLMWTDIRNVEKSCLSLVGVKVKGFRDQKTSWPKPGRLMLEGFTYEQLTLHEDSVNSETPKGQLTAPVAFDAKDRIAWINLQEEDRVRETEPWMQLVKIAQVLGDDRGARHVLYGLACRRAEKSRWPLRLAQERFAWLKEQPFRIAWSIGLILFLTTALFWSAGVSGAIAPREKEAYSAWAKGQHSPMAYPRFNPVIYSLENELPLVKFGQDENWTPDPAHRPVSFGDGSFLHWTWIFDSYGFLAWVRWFAIFFGWIQATVLAAALADRFRS